MPRYIVYARKSSESEDRQVLSIDSQIRELKDFARSKGIQVAAVLSEARSAKAPGRSVFGELLHELARGRVQGVICWKLDRLARNPVDGGALIWAFDEGKLHEIVTPQRTFSNTGNDKFWMQLEFGMAKKYVDDLSDNVKRGLRAKLAQGWLPSLPPIGYLNDYATRTIVPDPDRFPIVRKMWTQVLAGRSPVEVLARATTSWGLRTRKFKRLGSRPLARSAIYKMLSNAFYYGLLVRKEGVFPGAHEPMITKDEFDRVQEILGRPNRPHHDTHTFAYSGLVHCGECGATVTAEDKTNRYGSHYTYYHCSKRLAGTHCSQRTVRLEDLERQITTALGRIHVSDDYRSWAITHLRQVHEQETQARAAVDRSLDAAYRDSQKKLDALTDLRLQALLTDEEYAAKRQDLLGEQLRLKERLVDADTQADHWRDLAERAFIFANEAKARFANGALEEKREILLALGSNLVLKGRILRIQLETPLLFIEEGLQRLGSENSPFEPRVRRITTNENSGREAARLTWCATVDRVRTFFVTAPDTIRWPHFTLQKHDASVA
jgi:DNA invertase Pin-like site-specific DNA recombinase